MSRFYMVVFLTASLLAPTLLHAREKGWVPMQDAHNLTVPLKKSETRKKPVTKKKAAAGAVKSVSRQPGATVYDNQPPVTEKEITAFLDVLPRFRKWARQNRENAHPVVGTDGKPDFMYSPAAANWVAKQNFVPQRFFCVMGRLAAGLVIVEEGNDYKGTRPADMPAVTPQELGLVRKHLGELLTAGGPPQPLGME